MSYYNKQEYEFVKRTKILITQYEKFKIEEKEKYEVTLLLNCFVGLVILPQQHWKRKLNSRLIIDDTWGIRNKDILLIQGKSSNVLNIARHIRNSISHYRFKVNSNKSKIIDRIYFEDIDPSTDKLTFKADISINHLKIFSIKLANSFLKEMVKEK